MSEHLKRVLVVGRFNVVHPGHLRLLRFAKSCGDYLIVAVESDTLARGLAHVSENLRLEGLSSNSYVDEVFITDLPASELVKELKPDVVVKGKEYERQFNAEAKELAVYGGGVIIFFR